MDLDQWINEPLQSSSESDDDYQSDDRSNFFNLGGFDKKEEEENLSSTLEHVEKVNACILIVVPIIAKNIVYNFRTKELDSKNKKIILIIWN